MRDSNATWSFSLVLTGFAEATGEIEDALYEAGCSDALLSFYGTAPVLDFDRQAESYEHAVINAIDDVERAGISATVLRVEPDDLVNAADIARRSGVTREAVRLWIEAERGGGGFPPPSARVGKSTVWRWSEVARWLLKRREIDPRAVREAEFTAALNALLERERTAEIVSRAAIIEKQLRGVRRRTRRAE
jgi:hypothetical protein